MIAEFSKIHATARKRVGGDASVDRKITYSSVSRQEELSTREKLKGGSKVVLNRDSKVTLNCVSMAALNGSAKIALEIILIMQVNVFLN